MLVILSIILGYLAVGVGIILGNLIVPPQILPRTQADAIINVLLLFLMWPWVLIKAIEYAFEYSDKGYEEQFDKNLNNREEY